MVEPIRKWQTGAVDIEMKMLGSVKTWNVREETEEYTY
jgi:hypothetical protein